MLACWREGIVPLLQMHDGLELSVTRREQGERVAQLACGAVKLEVPMRADIKFGRSWGDATHKWDALDKEGDATTAGLARPLPSGRRTHIITGLPEPIVTGFIATPPEPIAIKAIVAAPEPIVTGFIAAAPKPMTGFIPATRGPGVAPEPIVTGLIPAGLRADRDRSGDAHQTQQRQDVCCRDHRQGPRRAQDR